MTHIVNVPAFANAIGRPLRQVEPVLLQAGFQPNAKPRSDNWLLPPLNNVTKYGPLTGSVSGASWDLGPSGSSAHIEVILDIYKPGHSGDKNYFTPFPVVTKITLFVEGKNWVQISGTVIEMIAVAALVGWATAGIGDAAIAAGAAADAADAAETASSIAEISEATTTTFEGSSTVADFGDIGAVGDFGEAFDYGNTFSSFDFSDGEAFTAVSDAQNVDFGFGTADVIPQDLPTPEGGFVFDDPSVSSFDLGATPEPSTGFGTLTGDPQYGDYTKLIAKEAENVAIKQATAPSKPTHPTSTATGGGTKNSQQTVVHQGSTLPVIEAGASPAIGGGVGVMGQIESMLGMTTTGQLKPNTGASSNGVTGSNMNTYLIMGAALIAFALLIKKV